jgi:hypothetical protein
MIWVGVEGRGLCPYFNYTLTFTIQLRAVTENVSGWLKSASQNLVC